MKTAILTAVFFLFAACLVYGDVVHMSDGRKLKGKIISETDDHVLLKGKYGEVTLKRHEIDHIEYGPVEEEEKPPTPGEKKSPVPKPKPKSKKEADLSELVDKAAKGDSSASKKLIEAKRAALVPIAKKLEKAEGEEKERLEKLRDEIEEKTQADKAEAQKHYEQATALLKKCYDMEKKLSSDKSEKVQAEFVALLREIGKELEKACALDPTREDVLKTLKKMAFLYWDKKLYSSAIPLLKSALAADPEDTKTMGVLVSCYMRMGKYKEANKLLDEILEKDPKNATAWANLGAIHHQKKKYKDAVECFEKAISLGLDTADIYDYLGTAYKYLKKDDKAIENFEKVLTKDPNHPNALFQLGALYNNTGKYAEAADAWEKFCKIQPNSEAAKQLKKEIPKLRKKAEKK